MLPEIEDLRDKVIEPLDREVYPIAIGRLKEEFQWMYEDEWEEYWGKTDPYEERTEHRYHRRYEMPAPFHHWDGRNKWQQYYFGRIQEVAFIMNGADREAAASDTTMGFMVTWLPF